MLDAELTIDLKALIEEYGGGSVTHAKWVPGTWDLLVIASDGTHFKITVEEV